MIQYVSVPSSGDYQFLQTYPHLVIATILFPSPHPGIINFFMNRDGKRDTAISFRPLIRGLSISSPHSNSESMKYPVSVPSSGDYQFLRRMQGVHFLTKCVSVPSSGDYQFLRSEEERVIKEIKFPSPHPGIINFFASSACRQARRQVSVPSSGDYQFLLKA